MRFYVTKEDCERVKSSFLNVRSFYIISVKEIVESLSFVSKTNYFNFLVNEEIKARIIDAVEKKKYSNIIYVNEGLDVEIIENVKEIVNGISYIEKIVFIDDEKMNEKLYPLFDEVIFFPKLRKVKIIECECIKNPLYYWLNNRSMPDK